ncbi:VWA domain-containing protein [Vibrio sp. Vb5031]|uniref:VWA domain-containing protein n=1 Tax=Vibrio TaxID=662 RepID=UPI0009A360D1|nr:MULTISPECIES: VWA domain-containing protein [unclassified Vibrio]MDW1505758.1 VWA domain-containing protein [Vibrio sp. Vb5031]MDW1517461.1 VWA domain-containing protein [Vibrio sp. Vb5035]MDW1547590.1 VWA domain-containing protein [Vibrio sp. Vb5034]
MSINTADTAIAKPENPALVMRRKQALIRKFTLLQTMNTGRSVGVKIQGTKACTSGNTTTLPLGNMEDPEYLDMLEGMIDHENGHCKHTDFSEWYSINNKMVRRLTNIFEDVRIEKLVGHEYPGSKTNLLKLVQIAIKRGLFSAPSHEDDLVRLVQKYILYTGRYKHLDQYPLKDFSQDAAFYLSRALPNAFPKLEAILTDSANDHSTADARRRAEDVLKVLQEEFEDQQQQEEEQDQDENQDDKSGDSGSNSENDEEQSESDDSDNSESSDDKGEGDQSGDQDSESDDKGDDNQSGKSETESDDEEGDDNQSGDSKSDSEDEGDDEQNGGSDAESDDEGDDSQSGDSKSDSDDEGDDEQNGGSDAESDDEGDDNQSGDSKSDSDDQGNDEQSGQSNTDSNDDADGDDSESQSETDSFSNQVSSQEIEKAINADDDDLLEDMHDGIRRMMEDKAEENLEEFQEEYGNEYSAPTMAYRCDKSPDAAGIPLWMSQARQQSQRVKLVLNSILNDRNRVKRSYENSGTEICAGTLWGVSAGNNRVFKTETISKSPNTAFSILIDRSGSMQGPNMEMANVAAFAIGQAIEFIKGAECEVLYYPFYDAVRQDGYVHIAKSFTERMNSVAQRSFNVHADHGTPTAEALQGATARLGLRKEPKKVLFLITDGQTSGATVQAALRECDVMGITVIGIGIGTGQLAGFEHRPYFAINSANELANSLFAYLRTYYRG